MAQQSFSAAVDAWARQTQARMIAVFRTSAEILIDEAQLPGPSVASTKKSIAKSKKRFIGPVAPGGGGGNMPIDTGFLRASGMASLEGMPVIREGSRPVEGKAYAYDDGQISTTIAGAELGQTIYFGWTAGYAPFVENRYGFARLSAQRWQEHVNRAVADAKARVGG